MDYKKDEETERLKALLVRAADALASTRPAPEFPKLIQELREAAKP